MVESLEKLEKRLMDIKHIERAGDRVRKVFLRQRRSSDSDEVKERLRRFFVRPKSEIHEDILMPQVALGRGIWNMINP